MSNRSILAAGAAMVLFAGVARAEEMPVPAPLTPVSESSEATLPDVAAVPAPVEATTYDASAPVAHEHEMSQETVQAEPPAAPLGDSASYASTPALGTPPSVSTTQPLVQSVAPAAPALPVVAAVPAAARPPVPLPMPVQAAPVVVHNGAVPLAVPAETASKDLMELSADDYRRKLSGCIKGSAGGGCEKRELTKLDRDYLRYDRGDKALSRDELDEVAEARMLQFDGASKVKVVKAEPSEAEKVVEAKRQQAAARRLQKQNAVAKAEPPMAPVQDAKPSVQASVDIKAVPAR